VHRQPAYRELGVPGGFPVSEKLSERILSLPLSTDHSEAEIAEVVAAAQIASK
jgi:dTDP-4-amino-4,6-dideoxygalactose transaminase